MSFRSAVLNPLRSNSECFLFLIAKELNHESSLYEMPRSERAVRVSIIAECQAAFAAPSERDEMSLAIPKLWLCVHERFSPYLFQ
jgi:hypothetical protein